MGFQSSGHRRWECVRDRLGEVPHRYGQRYRPDGLADAIRAFINAHWRKYMTGVLLIKVLADLAPPADDEDDEE